MPADWTDSRTAFDVLVVGGGNAGLSAAGRLIRRGISDVAVIEPHSVHTYRPLLSYVGGGQASLSSARRTQKSLTPRGCTWLQDTVTAVDPAENAVQCASGRSYRYADLILGTGLVPDTEALAGVEAAISSEAVASNYLDKAEKTWRLVQSMPVGGRAVFTVPRPPVSCTATTLKPLFLAADYWARTGQRPSLTLVIDRPQLLGVPELDSRFLEHLGDLGVEVLHRTTVSGLDPDQREITVTDQHGILRQTPYDFLHLVPPFRGPQWLDASGLTAQNTPGLIDVDPQTLRHRRYPNIWAAGDSANLDTDPSGGALRKQTSTLVDNLLAARSKDSFSSYDGYTVAPVTTSRRRLIFGEYDRSGDLVSLLPSFLDPLKSRRTAWAADRYALPQLYWNLIIKGRI